MTPVLSSPLLYINKHLPSVLLGGDIIVHNGLCAEELVNISLAIYLLHRAGWYSELRSPSLTRCHRARLYLWPHRRAAVLHLRLLRPLNRRSDPLLQLIIVRDVLAVQEVLARGLRLAPRSLRRKTISLFGNSTRANEGLGLRMRMLLLSPYVEPRAGIYMTLTELR